MADSASARAHFEKAIELVRVGSLEQAVSEFERAYSASPHHSVLFNLGQAYVALGRPIEAAQAFERYLAEGGEQIPPAKRAQVKELIALQRFRVSYLELDVAPAGAEVIVDGRSIGKSPFGRPVSLVAGTHGVVVALPGATPWFGSRSLAPGATERIVVRLEAPRPQAQSSPIGQLQIDCGVPSAAVVIDSKERARTPLAFPLLLTAERHEVRFVRAGYIPVVREVWIQAGSPSRISCGLEPNRSAVATTAKLAIITSPANASVLVDGRAYDGRVVPTGPHDVEVELSGFRKWHRSLELRAGEVRRLDVRLSPESVTRASWEAARAERRKWSFVLGAAGIALVGTGVATYVWSDARYDRWRRNRDALDARIAESGATSESLQQDAALDREALRLQRTSHVGIGFAAVGLLLGVASAVIGVGTLQPGMSSTRLDAAGWSGRW